MQAIPAENLPLVSAALRDFPRPDSLALNALRQWLAERDIEDSPLNIDVVTFHYQLEPLGEGRTHFRENAVITQKMNLVEALLCNWQGETAAGYGGFHYGDWAGLAPSGTLRLVERLETHQVFSNASDHLVFNGLYRQTEPAEFGPHTRLTIRAEDFQGFIWSLHFHTAYKALLDKYWRSSLDLYRRALKINFIAACNRQVSHASLSEPGRQLAWQAAGLLPPSHAPLRVSMLNVYGYASSSILCLHNTHTGLTLLYIPGNSYPFHEFIDRSSMQRWFAEQCRDSAKRKALLHCFSPADWPDGLEFSGARTALKGLGVYPKAYRLSTQRPGFTTSGTWHPEEIVDYRAERYSPPLSGDLFAHLARLRQKRSYADADSQIISNHQIDKANWTNYLNIALGMLAPVAMVLPVLTPLLAFGGLAQFALGMDKLLHGRDAEEQAAGVQLGVFGLLNAAPLAGNGIRLANAVFRFRHPGFFSSGRLDSLLGERVGAAPVLDALELQPAQVAFRESPAPEAVEQAVIRRIDSGLLHCFSARLLTEDGIVNEWVEYELGSDSFVRQRQAGEADGQRWIPSHDDPQVLVRRDDPDRPVTDQGRMARLRSLGIEVDLPIDFSSYAALPRTPIPRLVSSLWVGDRLLTNPYLEALIHNARALEHSEYHYRLLLSQQDLIVYQDNLTLLRTRAPSLEVLKLEEQPFFHDFVESPYYPQYQAALGTAPGSVSNFASACDILRYRLLAHYGGLYLDADDLMLLPNTAQPSSLPLNRIELSTTADGLLLAPPVSNDQMGLYIKFNNSLIGSHPGNPTLDALSDEVVARYQLQRTFYQSRPDALLQPEAFEAYARQLSQLTGPAVLNDVIDQRLPWLRQLRELCNLMVSPVHDLHATLDLSQFLTVLREHVPLNQVASIGSGRSWQHQ
ncbi:dermonecrotic toxin domain-containing protein [Pseudomonas cremoricolorata]|uniref:Mannosyltransferase n=1 Tax=Pseudomonas cremoricolorata TaxID=157783 RepID=A0A089YED3_9PSED|nr:DUF6543 domain-containing protein [Pseudomonas cremoricolorata]AIR90103.1 mannosyltransferase [Pseudomonas cremoricolorata]